VRVLGRQAQKWARITKNKIVRAEGPKWTIYRLGRAVTFGIRADLIGCPMVSTRSSDSLRGVDCKIPHWRVRSWLLALLVVLVANLLYAFWGVRLRNGLASPRTKLWGRKAQNKQYTAGWAGLLHILII